jgi:hypothetical protein
MEEAAPTKEEQRPDLTLTKEELEMVMKARQARAAEPSPKRSKSEEPDWQQFLESLAAKDIEFGDLDPQFQQTLKTDVQARKDFLDLNLTAPEVQHFNTDSGKMEKLDLSKKRPFNSITEVPILATSEEKIKEAMMQYHQDTFLPNLNALIDNCHKIYHNTVHELYYNQLKVDMIDSRLKTLEARFGNKSLLIKGLPAHGYNRTELERNVWHYFQKSGVSWDCLAAMHTHTLTTDSSVMRLEFTTEIARNEFFQHMRNTKNVWLIHGKEYGKAKVENDIPTSDRLALQPYYTLLDLFQDILPADMKGSNGELQSDRATLQIWPDKNASTQQLLAQVTYLLDNRFPRRYVCVLFIVENYLEEIQQKWFDAFTHRMQQTLELIQALSRSAVDKTTTARHNFDKAFDISNIRFPHQQFPFPIIFISMAPSLAKLLSDHPSLPLQGATGLLPIVSNVLMKYQINPSDYGKGGKSKGKLNNKGSGKSTGKGKLSNKGKAHSDRTPDQTYYGKKWDDNHDSSGSGHWTPGYRPRQTGTSMWKSTARSSAPSGKGKTSGNTYQNDFILCTMCLCALGFNSQCPDCSANPIPPGFSNRAPLPVRTMWCPGTTPNGDCDAILGMGKCPLCEAHRSFWRHERNVYQQHYSPPTEFCRYLQLDKCLYHLNLAVDHDFLQYVDKATAALDGDFHRYDQEQRALRWVATASSESQVRQFLPLPHTGKLAFTLPDLQKDSPSMHNTGWTLDDHFAREHFFLVDFYVDAVNSFWDDYQNDILQEWQIFDAPSVDICRTGLIPWDQYVAASAVLMVEESNDLGFNSPPTTWDRFFATYLENTFDEPQHHYNQTVDKLTNWVNSTDLYINIFIGYEPFNNEPLKNLSAIATNFTDLAYWQLASIFKRLPRDRSQLQIPNDILGEIWSDIAKQLDTDPQHIQWSINRRWCSKGNSIEVLLYLLAEDGNHLDFWQAIWLIFMCQHKGAGLAWVVSVY